MNYLFPLNELIFCKSDIKWFEFHPLGFAKRTDARTALSFFLAKLPGLNRSDHERPCGIALAGASNPKGIADIVNMAL